MTTNFKYDDEKSTLQEVFSTTALPEVLRICESKDECQNRIGYRYYSFIKPGTEILLQRKQKVKYAHINVLKFYDNAAAQKEKGAEYVLEHDTFVGEEYLIPVNFKGKLRFTHRPGSWRRYATIAQLLEATPRYVKVADDIDAYNANNLNEQIYVPAKTVLEVVREFHSAHNGASYLELKDENASYAFSVTDLINFTEVEDPKQYHLFELVRFKMLPKAILFEEIELKDAILVDKELNSGMMTSLDGPVDLLGFVDVEHLVGLIRDKQAKVYRTVLIPQRAWNTVLVQKRIFLQDSDRDKYIKTKYGPCKSTDFVDKCMYWMPLDQTQVTWLRNPEYYKPAKNDMELYQRVKTEFPDSSDDDVYTEITEFPKPAPPVPPRQGQSVKCSEPSVWMKSRLKRIQFKKVHKELIHMFVKKHPHKVDQTDRPPARPPKPPNLQRSLSERQPLDKGHGTMHLNAGRNTADQFRGRSYSMKDYEPKHLEPGKPHVFITSKENHKYDYPYVSRIFEKSPPKQSDRSQERPLPPIPDKEAENQSTQENSKDVLVKRAEHLKKQTANNFFNYTVPEVKQCCIDCGLDDFGSKCLENKLDGKFFEGVDLDNLKDEPFNLTTLQMLKVRKMIYDGWRPNKTTDVKDKEQNNTSD